MEGLEGAQGDICGEHDAGTVIVPTGVDGADSVEVHGMAHDMAFVDVGKVGVVEKHLVKGQVGGNRERDEYHTPNYYFSRATAHVFHFLCFCLPVHLDRIGCGSILKENGKTQGV